MSPVKSAVYQIVVLSTVMKYETAANNIWTVSEYLSPILLLLCYYHALSFEKIELDVVIKIILHAPLALLHFIHLNIFTILHKIDDGMKDYRWHLARTRRKVSRDETLARKPRHDPATYGSPGRKVLIRGLRSARYDLQRAVYRRLQRT